MSHANLLGTGKTTFLEKVLKNKAGIKFGVLVNDVASVNIDSKIIQRSTIGDSEIDTLELQNGCVCCSLADDMLVSIRQFADLASKKGTRYDHIILECSGIAEPRRIRDLFREMSSMPDSGLSTVSLDTLVTVIDAKVFSDLFGSDDAIKSHKSLAVIDGADANEAAENEMGMRSVTELLVEQVECADVVIINKADLLESDALKLASVRQVIESINPTARVETCSHGLVPNPMTIIGSAGGKGMATISIVDEHKKAVSVADTSCGHGHSHDHHNDSEHKCTELCKDGHHDHSHDGHEHSHDHHNDSEHKCTELCKDGHHDHSHDGHEHSHDHGSTKTTASERFGISSFVYRRRRPFHPERFYRFLEAFGSIGIKGIKDINPSNHLSVALDKNGHLQDTLLRSKGFVWMSTSASLGYYMSQAGQFLELNVLGTCLISYYAITSLMVCSRHV